MREILFRGKRLDNGEWIEGDIIRGKLKQSLGKFYIDSLEIQIDNNGYLLPIVEVVPETVGQYTGLTDKNCKKVFEGDICRLLTRDCGEERKYAICYGEFCDCNSEDDFIGFYISGEIDSENIKCSILQDSVICNSEVIGNIHDNPELL